MALKFTTGDSINWLMHPPTDTDIFTTNTLEFYGESAAKPITIIQETKMKNRKFSVLGNPFKTLKKARKFAESNATLSGVIVYKRVEVVRIITATTDD